jgi:hypothetical protein
MSGVETTMVTEHPHRAARASGYIGSIIVGAILLYVAQHVLDWHLGWVKPSWADVLWAINLSLELSIVVNAVLIVYDARWFRHLGHLVGLAGALLAGYWLYVVFPFEFGSFIWNQAAQVAMLAMVLLTGIGALATGVLFAIDVLRFGTSMAPAGRP